MIGLGNSKNWQNPTMPLAKRGIVELLDFSMFFKSLDVLDLLNSSNRARHLYGIETILVLRKYCICAGPIIIHESHPLRIWHHTATILVLCGLTTGATRVPVHKCKGARLQWSYTCTAIPGGRPHQTPAPLADLRHPARHIAEFVQGAARKHTEVERGDRCAAALAKEDLRATPAGSTDRLPQRGHGAEEASTDHLLSVTGCGAVRGRLKGAD